MTRGRTFLDKMNGVSLSITWSSPFKKTKQLCTQTDRPQTVAALTKGWAGGKIWWNRLSTWAKMNTMKTCDETIRHRRGISNPPTHQVIRTGSFSNSANYRNYPFQITDRPANPRMTTHMSLFSRDRIALLSVRKTHCTLKSHPPPLPNHSPSRLL